jgi:hypothetical protein
VPTIERLIRKLPELPTSEPSHSGFTMTDAFIHLRRILLLFACASFLGCSDQKAILPTSELTEEQKQAIKAEDAQVADEESHGYSKKRKK